MTTQEWDAAVGTALLRLGVGAGLLRWRRQVAVVLGGRPGDRVVEGLVVYFGLRDASLGVTALASSRPGRSVSRQLLTQALADATDAALVGAATATGRLRRDRGLAAVALAVGSAAAELAAAGWLRRSRA